MLLAWWLVTLSPSQPDLLIGASVEEMGGIRLRRDSWNMTAVTQKCTACPSLAAAALEA